MKGKTISALFLDIGGVLLTNGWGHDSRVKAVAHFNLNSDELNERHHLTFDTYEEGKLSLNEYLKRVVFYEERSFSQDDFIAFMFKESLPFQATIDFFKAIKKKYLLKIIAVSNEGRELNEFRIAEYKLHELFDAFVSSSFVHLRKPDADIFRMAIDISQTAPEDSLYIDDRLMFVEVARTLGMPGIHHQRLDETKRQMREFGFEMD
ncbi:MAG: HAD family hydrolase [Bacteroidota bacterium]